MAVAIHTFLPCAPEHRHSVTGSSGYFHHNSPLDDTTFGGVVTAFSANDAEQIDLTITHSLFEENGTSNTATGYYPVLLDGPGIRLVMSDNTFANNQVNRVMLQNNPLKTQPSAVLTRHAAWKPMNSILPTCFSTRSSAVMC